MRARLRLTLLLTVVLLGSQCVAAHAGGPATYQSSLGSGAVGQGDVIETFSMWCGGDAYCNAGGTEDLWPLSTHAVLTTPANMCTPSRMRLQINGGPPAAPGQTSIDLTTATIAAGQTVTIELPDQIQGGVYNVGLSALDTSSNEGCSQNPNGDFTVKMTIKAARPHDFSAVGPHGSLSDLSVGDLIGYQGSGWRTLGPRVAITLGHSRIGTGSPASFAGRFKLPDWPNWNCTTTLVANQQGVKATLVLRGKSLGSVEAGTATLGTRKLKRDSFVCAGEHASGLRSAHLIISTESPSLGIAPRTLTPQGIVPTTDENAFDFRGLAIYDQPDRVQIDGGVFARDVSVGSLRSTGGVPDPHLLDPAGELGVTPIGSTLSGGALSGIQRSSGNLTITGGITLDGALLYVPGNLVLRGGLHGTGAIVVAGSASVQGAVALRPDYAGLAFEAGGSLRFSH